MADMVQIIEKAVGLIGKLTDVLDGKQGKDGFSAGVGGYVADFFNGAMSYLQRNAIKLQDIQLNYAKQLGSTRTAAYETMQRAVDITALNRLDQDFGFSAQDYQRGLFNIQSNLGRQVGLGQEGAGVFAAGDVLYGDKGKTMGEISAAFMQVGSNMESVGETVSKMFTNAHKSGLSFQKISASVKAHLKEVNQYGFKNGIDGMRQMAEYAEKIGMDMSQVLKATEKTSSLTGAVDVAARLSVLGGNFQKLGNPLQMLNESLTDVESYQKRIGAMFNGMAKWDAQKGMISVSAVDRMRINEAASAMGLDKNEVFKSVETQARRDMIEKQIGIGLTPELKNLIANVGTINKEGRAGIIDKNGEFRDVSEIAGNTELQKEIKDLNKTEGENIQSIAYNVQSMYEKMSAYYERQVNLKTKIELGDRDKYGNGGTILRRTENTWSSQTQDENSLLNDLTRVSLNGQKLATAAIEDVRNYAIEGIGGFYGAIKDGFDGIAKRLNEIGVTPAIGVKSSLEKELNDFIENSPKSTKEMYEEYKAKKAKNGGTIAEVGDIIPDPSFVWAASPVPATTISSRPYNGSGTSINPTNNFTITIAPESKYTWTNEDNERIRRAVDREVNDILREQEVRANMVVGAR